MSQWWLAGGRLEDDTRNWRGLVQLLIPAVTTRLKQPDSDQDRLSATEVRRYVGAADELFSPLARRGLMDEEELLGRRVVLALALAEAGFSVPDAAFAPQRVIGLILADVAPDRLAEAERLSPNWTSLPRSDIRGLRRWNQLVRLGLEMRDHLTDPAVVATVSSWEPLYPVLPGTGLFHYNGSISDGVRTTGHSRPRRRKRRRRPRRWSLRALIEDSVINGRR
ncbi:hypothetical protein AB0F91_41440 [Amycolatopsis sp. NPDC023774]|uniref:hypothetical protein n=1 Tax=Amycolatopsis sp. NPDC023774 TaxID=3155015 RepID=UPI0033FF9496